MNKLLTTILTAALTLSLAAQQPATSTETVAKTAAPVSTTENWQSRIVAVTVHPGWGWVTREGAVQLNPGSNRVVLAGLPDSVDPELIRVEVDGAGVYPASAVLTSRDLKEARKAALEAIDARIETANWQLKLLEAQLADLDLQAKELQSLLQMAAGLGSVKDKDGKSSNPGVTVESLQKLAEHIRDTRSSQVGERLKLQEETAEAKKELAKLQEEREKESKRDAYSETFITVMVSAATAESATLRVSYLAGGVCWYPRHNARLGDGVAVDLTTHAVIHQVTGEGWTGAVLTLSSLSAEDRWGNRDAESGKRRAGRLNVYLDKRWKRAADDKDSTVQAQFEQGQQHMHAALGSLRARSMVTELTAAGKVTLTDGNVLTTAALQRRKLRGELELTLAPYRSAHAHRHIRLVNAGADVLLPGEVNCFVGNELLTTQTLAPAGPEEVFLVDFGRSQAIKIDRRIDLTESSASRYKAYTRLAVQYRMNLRLEGEGLTQPVKVTVSEQWPAVTGKGVAAELIGVVPRAEVEGQKLEWSVTLKPGATTELLYQVQIEYPRGQVPAAFANLERTLLAGAE
jgi:uncharacterized protein (TIGR02231 family)